MRASRFLALFGGALALGWAAQFLRGPAAGERGPAAGTLAPFDSSITSAWELVATLDAADLGGGRVRALDVAGDTLLVLQSNQWSLFVGGEHVGTFGTPVVGAPGFLSSAVGIGFQRDAIVVLDGARHRLTRWSRTGEPIAEYEMQPTVGLGSQRSSLVAGDDAIYIPTYVMADAGGSWDLERLRGSERDTLIQRHGAGQRGAAYDSPVPVPLSGGRALVVDATGWRLRVLSASGAAERSSRRESPPQYAIPSRARVKMRAMLEQVPPAQRLALEMPDALSPVFTATVVDDTLLLTVIRASDESALAELLTFDGTPIARPWRDPDPHPIFAVRGALYRVRELDDVTLIERQRISLPRR
jgi:hypothetical protein